MKRVFAAFRFMVLVLVYISAGLLVAQCVEDAANGNTVWIGN